MSCTIPDQILPIGTVADAGRAAVQPSNPQADAGFDSSFSPTGMHCRPSGRIRTARPESVASMTRGQRHTLGMILQDAA